MEAALRKIESLETMLKLKECRELAQRADQALLESQVREPDPTRKKQITNTRIELNLIIGSLLVLEGEDLDE
jgi:hypothetical protein